MEENKSKEGDEKDKNRRTSVATIYRFPQTVM
jgi:hypothetical protein